MIISSKRKLEIKGVKIIPGVRNYLLDHKDPLTAHELYILKFEQKVIFFEEILPMEKKINEEKKKKVSAAIERAQKRIDRINKTLKPHVEKEEEPDVREVDEGIGRPERDGDTDSGGGDVPSKKKNASAGSRALPKRRNRKNKTS